MREFFDKFKNTQSDVLFNEFITEKYEKGRVYCGDCLEILPTIAKESVDMILTDAPYGIANSNKITKSKKSKKKNQVAVSYDFGEWDIFNSDDEFLKFTFDWLDLCHNVLKPGGMLITFFNRDKINFISQFLINKHRYKCKGYYLYIKKNPVPQVRKVKFMNAWEIAGIWQKPGGKLTFNHQHGQQPDYMLLPICSGHERTKHPTQKPLKLLYPLIRYFTNPGDTILDPFSGSGTTAIACRNLDRQFIAIEKEPEYYKSIQKRLNDFQLRRNESTGYAAQLPIKGL